MLSSIPHWVPIVLLSLDWAIRLILAAVVIARRRTPSASLAWIVVLVFIPVVGLIVYILVGENRLGYRRLRRYEELTKGIEAQAIKVWFHRHLITESDSAWSPIAHYGLNATGFPPLKNNRLTLLNDSEDFLHRLCEDITHARHHVHLLTYIWQTTGAGQRLAQTLIDAASRNVRCRVLVDGAGSAAFLKSDLPVRLRAAGVDVVEALPVNPLRLLFARIDLRNHRKIAVIDGKVAYVGSQNISDTSFRSNPHRQTGPWIDASLRVEGPAVYALQAIFLRDWLMDSSENIGSIDPFIPPFEKPSDNDHACVVQVIPSGPGIAPDAIHQALLTTIYHARDELVMTTPYFVPDDATRTALQAAATRGVRVTLVMPRLSDSPLVAAASRSHYLDLLESGVRILHYRDGLLHAKTVVVDHNIALISSANFDARSFWLNFEVTLFVYDDDFASVLRFMQNDYIAQSDEITLDQWRSRSTLETFRDNAAQLLGPLL